MPFKTKKVFDCQDMPEDLKRKFFELDDHNRGNDCYIDWWIASDMDADENTKAIDQWLIDNGADPGTKDKCGEEVLIKHWW